ncbi:hypothetical protein ACQ4M4_05935 [Leptolyngbya sp. AN02str]|uniref:hypothetical protein n=1 Tax=Leptolyngbya sp. AN02str TaxID=3423363 RepID=UPI003D31D4C9
MEVNREMKHMTAQLLSGMLANPHLYPTIPDEGTLGPQEQKLMAIAMDMAEYLVAHINERTQASSPHPPTDS